MLNLCRRLLENGLEVIWLIEEPEAFLHPILNDVCKRLLFRINSKCLVVITTHSLSFVPQDPRFTAGVIMEDGKTLVNVYKTYRESTEAIRKAIGVRFSDFFNFGKYNILLEGQSDREYLQWLLEIIPSGEEHDWPALRSEESHFLDYGGVKHLAGFLRATWEFIRTETCAVAVFDGDPAGEKERKDLQHYFGNKRIPFQANEDFVSVRKGFPIEALFPDDWINEAYEKHPGWFSDYSVDASGELESFELKDGSKKSFAIFMKEKASKEQEITWAERWINVCSAINEALTTRLTRIEANKVIPPTVSVASAHSVVANG